MEWLDGISKYFRIYIYRYTTYSDYVYITFIPFETTSIQHALILTTTTQSTSTHHFYIVSSSYIHKNISDITQLSRNIHLNFYQGLYDIFCY